MILLVKRVSILLFAFIMSSCITQKQYEDMNQLASDLQIENESLQSSNHELIAENKDIEREVATLNERINKLISDTLAYGNSFRRLNAQYDRMINIQKELEGEYTNGLSQQENTNKALIGELEMSRNELLKFEDSLRKLESELEAERLSLENSQKELALKEQKINELNEVLELKNSYMKLLRTKIEEALFSLKGEGLSLEQKQGKIYVRMDASLLFPSGSVIMNEKGKAAIIRLAKSIQDQQDLQIVIEGHTDSDAVNPGGKYSDNWELSVLRATTVTKIMIENSSLDPQILTASGQSEYHPVDVNDKSKNRRIEIILSPNLDILFSILDSELAE
jgi:chemotaxis protein MotB